MPSDTDAIIVRIIATQKEYEKQMASVARSAERAAKAAEGAFKKSNDNIAGGARKGATQVQQGFKGAGQAASQLSFQLNDIATSLSGGASPFQVMMQQGSQVTQVMQQVRAAGGSMAQVLAGAFSSVLNPISLVSFALIGLVGYVIQYFSAVKDGSADAAVQLRKHADELEKIAKDYGSIFPELKRLADLRRAEADAAEQASAKETALAEAYADTDKKVTKLGDDLIELQGLGQLGVETDEIDKTSKSFSVLEAAVKAHTASAKEAVPLLDSLQKIIDANAGRASDLAKVIRSELVAAMNELEASFKSAQITMSQGLPFTMPGGGGPLDLAPLLRAREGALDASLNKAADAIDAFVERVIQSEGPQGGPNRAGASSAFGPGQFLKSTWLSVFKSHFAQEAAGMSDAAILALRSDLETNRRMIRAYAQDNSKVLIAANQDVTEANLHLAHFLGAGGAVSVLQARPGTRVADIPGLQDAIRSNPTILGGGATREDVLAYAQRRANAPERVKEEKTSYDDLVKSINDKIAAQQRENEINGDSTKSTDEKTAALQEEKAAQEAARVEEELNNAAKQQGIPLTDELRAKNHELAAAYGAAGLAADQLSVKQKQAAKAAQEQTQAQQQLAQQVGQMVGGAITGFISDLRNGVSAGDAFNNMLNRILDSLIQMAVQMLIVKPLTEALGGIGGVGVGSMAGGGTVGLSRHMDGRKFSPALWAGAPRFATGGVVGLRPGEIPIVAHKGEVVVPKARVGRHGGGAYVDNSHTVLGPVSIDMSQSGFVGADNESAKQFGMNIQKMIRVEMVRESRPGGLLRRS
jgi:hypothetical protein